MAVEERKKKKKKQFVMSYNKVRVLEKWKRKRNVGNYRGKGVLVILSNPVILGNTDSSDIHQNL